MELVWSKIAIAREKYGDQIVNDVIQLEKDIGDFETEKFYIELDSDEHLEALNYLFPVVHKESQRVET